MQAMKHDLKTIQNRQAALRELIRDYHDGNSTRFAEFIGVQANTVGRWQNKDYENSNNFRPIPDFRCRAIEELHKKPRYWMDNPSIDKDQNTTNIGAAVQDGQNLLALKKAEQKIQKLPRLDSSQACHPTQSIAGGDVEYFPVGTAVCSDNSFFFTVEDDSMVRDGHPSSLPVGTDLIIDMSEQPLPGDVVLAATKDAVAAIPRLFKDHGQGRYSLVPLNDFYPTIDDAEIIGVVMSVNIPLRARRNVQGGSNA